VICRIERRKLSIFALSCLAASVAAVVWTATDEDPTPAVAPTAAATAEPTAATATFAGGTAQRLPEQTRNPHVAVGERHPPYNSRPATSGWHHVETVRWGVHDVVIPDEYLVHNLEHGGVGIHYDCPQGCDDLVEELAAIARRYDKTVMSPYQGMDTTIGLTSWTFIDRLDEVDEKRITEFIEAHMSQPPAPEYSVR